MNEPPRNTAAIIVAAGRGTRAGGDVAKQWQPLLGRRVLDWTVDAFLASAKINIVVVVVPPGGTEPLPDGTIRAHGGDTRAASVRSGLDTLAAASPDYVLIHDAARACITTELIDDVIAALDSHTGAAPGVAVSDALWRGESTVEAKITRDGLVRAQTPQGFHFDAICAAHAENAGNAADDVELAIATGLEVAILPGDEDNLKITTKADFARAKRILAERNPMDIRVGNGFDVHAFGVGDHVILCGVKVPFERGLIGHSDADVGMHAVTDAIFGALADGDIGKHFPPSDPQWKGAASDIFLSHAAQRVTACGFAISNIDCTLICEKPKIGPHAAAMRARLADILGVEIDRVSVKATTSEQLGFTGRGEGIAAMATATLGKT